MAREKTKKWLRQHLADTYVKKANQQGLRARAAFKLQEIVEHDMLFKNCRLIVDLGSAPGSWSQTAKRLAPAARVIALDRLPMEPIAGVNFLLGDFEDAETYQALLTLLGEDRVDLVLSDMAPNLSGIKHADQSRSLALAETLLEFSCKVLAPGGSLLIKIFQGSGVEAFKKELASHFESVVVRKPKASKLHSSEIYLLARNFYLV